MSEPLANPRYELFALGLASGKTADAAYQDAGFRAHRGNACRLSAKESIRNRVRALQEAAAQTAVLTKAEVLERLARNAETAFRLGQIAASNQALRLYGVEIGMFAERRIDLSKTVDNMTEEELRRALGLDAETADKLISEWRAGARECRNGTRPA